MRYRSANCFTMSFCYNKLMLNGIGTRKSVKSCVHITPIKLRSFGEGRARLIFQPLFNSQIVLNMLEGLA